MFKYLLGNQINYFLLVLEIIYKIDRTQALKNCFII
jgi:hypothetical protein